MLQISWESSSSYLILKLFLIPLIEIMQLIVLQSSTKRLSIPSDCVAGLQPRRDWALHKELPKCPLHEGYKNININLLEDEVLGWFKNFHNFNDCHKFKKMYKWNFITIQEICCPIAMIYIYS